MTKITNLRENNHISFKIPTSNQLENFIYKYREQLVAENYPEVKQYLTEIVSKTYSASLKMDEMFFIF